MSTDLGHELIAALDGTLSSDESTRRSAEAALTTNLHARPETARLLSAILLDASVPLHLQQAAALSLRLLVRQRWSPYFGDSFVGYAPDSHALPIEVKAVVRANLLQALAIPNRRVRLATAYTLAPIAGAEWPDDFPELLPTLHRLLQPSSDDQAAKDGVHGALALLGDFVSKDMDENQLLLLGNELLPSLERILAQSQSYSPHVRARTIVIFRQLLDTLFMIRDEYPDASKKVANDVLPRWLAALQDILQQNPPAMGPGGGDPGAWENLAILHETFKTLRIATHFRSHFKPHLQSFAELALSTLSSLLPVFQTYYTKADDGRSDPPEPAEGDTDIAAGVPIVAAAILDFLAEAARGDRLRPFLLSESGEATAGLKALVSHLLAFTSMTREDEEEWTDDANAFVAATDETTETVGSSLRLACSDVLGDLLDAMPTQMMTALGAAISQQVTFARQAKESGDADWWKVEESTLTALGGVAESVLDIVESSDSKALDIGSIFEHVVLPNVTAACPPFLRGRSFVFASQFAATMPPALAAQVVQAAVEAIEKDGRDGSVNEEPVVVRLSAVRTIKNFHHHLASDVVAPFAPRIVASLGPLLAHTSEDTLVLLLEAIQSVVSDDATSETTASSVVPAEVYGEIVRATLAVWQPFSADPILLSVVADLLEALAGHPTVAVGTAVLSSALPVLCSLLTQDSNSTTATGAQVASSIAQSSSELITCVLRSAAPTALHESNAVALVTPPLLATLQTTDDRDIIQYSIQGLTYLVRKVPEVLLNANVGGSPVLQSICSVVGRILTPTPGASSYESEVGGLAMGDFLIALLRKAGPQLAPVLPDLVHVMISRLALAQTASFAQSLILPIVYLIHTQRDVVLDLLANTPLEVSGAKSSGLQVLAARWAAEAETFQGFWANRLSTVALCSVLSARQPPLEQLEVRGDPLPNPNAHVGIRTRSRTKNTPIEYQQIPWPAKVLKVLIKDWQGASRGPPELDVAAGARTPDTDDEDGEWDDDEDDNAVQTDRMTFLSDMLGADGARAIEDDGLDLFSASAGAREDPDLRNDELYSIDLKGQLEGYFRSLASETDVQDRLGRWLNEEETTLLRKAIA